MFSFFFLFIFLFLRFRCFCLTASFLLLRCSFAASVALLPLPPLHFPFSLFYFLCRHYVLTKFFDGYFFSRSSHQSSYYTALRNVWAYHVFQPSSLLVEGRAFFNCVLSCVMFGPTHLARRCRFGAYAGTYFESFICCLCECLLLQPKFGVRRL